MVMTFFQHVTVTFLHTGRVPLCVHQNADREGSICTAAHTVGIAHAGSHAARLPVVRFQTAALACSGFINSTGTCSNSGGCSKGDTCVFDYDDFVYDACCERCLSHSVTVFLPCLSATNSLACTVIPTHSDSTVLCIHSMSMPHELWQGTSQTCTHECGICERAIRLMMIRSDGKEARSNPSYVDVMLRRGLSATKRCLSRRDVLTSPRRPRWF